MSAAQRRELNSLLGRGWVRASHYVYNEQGSIVQALAGAGRGLHAYFTITRDGKVIVS